MKTLLRHSISAFVLVTVLLVSTFAAPLSPGLYHIAANTDMVKTGNSYAGVLFTATDFINATSLEKLSSITITSLPPATDGTLYLGSVPVAINQSIAEKNLSSLKFVPSADAKSASFTFETGLEYAITCHMKIIDEINFSPVAASYESSVATWTQQDIACYGSLAAYDPEGDTLLYEIVEYPKKGLLDLQNAEHGDFKYTPYVNCSGQDSFTYRVRDTYGNYSDIAICNVTISRKAHSLVFSDMQDHWAHSAAIEVVMAGVMDYALDGATPVFMPTKTVTREEFLVMVMHALEANVKDANAECHTVFADDSDIDAENRAFVAAAYNAGIVNGRKENGVVVFAPKDPITRAEAAVIMNNILGVEAPLRVSLFSDNDTIPAWAQSALYALSDVGVLRGTGAGTIDPFSTINRAQAAQILVNLMQYVD